MSALNSTAAARLAAAALFVFAPLVLAQETPPAAADPSEAAWKAAGEAMQPGPTVVTLRDQAQINLPEGYAFVPPKEGAALMEVMGNRTDDNFLGLIFPQSDA
jgi:uncharacterized membrane-anchored protein